MRHRTRHSEQRGFTLAEMMVTLAVIAILAGMALPSWRQTLRRQQLRAAASDFIATLATARSEALSRGQAMLVAPADANGWQSGWSVFADLNGNGTQDSDEKTAFRHEALALPLSVSGKPDAIAFNAYGRAQADSWTFVLDDRTKVKIILNLLGRPRSCDPVAEAASC